MNCRVMPCGLATNRQHDLCLWRRTPKHDLKVQRARNTNSSGKSCLITRVYNAGLVDFARSIATDVLLVP